MIYRRSLSLLFVFFLAFCHLSIHIPASQADTIHGTPGNDIITVPPGTPYGGVISYEGQDIITVEEGAEVFSDIQHQAESTADAAALAIDAGSGNDLVTNYGIIGAKAGATALDGSDRASQAKANATGISTAAGADLVDNILDISATATSTSSFTFPYLPSLSNGANAEAVAVGIDAGGDEDQIANSASINTVSEANASSFATLPTTGGSGIFFLPPNATSHSTGITGGVGNDGITNTATIDVTAISHSKSVAITPTLQEVKGGAISEAIAVGILALDGDDQIANESAVHARAGTQATSESVMLNLAGFGAYAVPTTATAGATGIAASADSDSVTNNGTVEANAISDAYTASGTVTVLQYEVTADGDARTEAKTSAVGIEAGDGDDSAINTGTITPTAYSSASTLDVSIEILGDVKANYSTTSSSTAVGIEGGAGNDGISNSGHINMNTTNAGNSLPGVINLNTITAVAESKAVDVKMFNIPTAFGEYFGADLGDAKTEAKTDATGIAGGSGNDTIGNAETIDIFALADADSTTVTAALSITASPKVSGLSAGVLGTASVAAARSAAPLAATAGKDSEEDGNIVDTGTVARTFVTGIDGGEGIDTVSNTGKITVKGESDADSVSVNPTVSITKGSILNIFPGAALAESGTTARTVVTGMNGGAGNDTLTNEDEVVAEANAYSTSANVAVLFKETTTKGLAWGGAISDAETEAIATAAGISGAKDDDTIENSGKIVVTAKPDADSASISATLMGTKEGLAAGFTYADAATKADATATGIDGGEGADTITNTNTGQIEVTANPESTSASVGVTVEGSFSQEWSAILGGAVADGYTKAVSRAAGIDAGDNNDTIENAGQIKVLSNPDTDSASVTFTLTGTQDGLAAGFSYADAVTTAAATAVGISGGAGDDSITNKITETSTGQIDVTANPTSTSASVGVTVSGVTKGTGIVGGAAMADGTTTAKANVTGIDGGEGSDTLTNDGRIVVNTHPDADSASVVVDIGASLGELGLVGGVSYADNETTASATATGIDGGADYDFITNSGDIEITTGPTSTSASVAVTVEAATGLGAAVGAALTDGTTKAISNAPGIKGGEGEDSIDNSGDITINSTSVAKSTSVSVDIVGGKEGAAIGASYADATTTAVSITTGIEDKTGKAAVKNSGNIESSATGQTDSESVSVTATAEKTGLAAGVSLADLTTKSTAASYGIDTGEIDDEKGKTAPDTGEDTIDNLGTVETKATATTNATSVAVEFSGALTGVTAGVSAAGTDVTAKAFSTGLRSGGGDDTIGNDGVNNADGFSLDSSANATSSSDTVAVTVSGAWEGVALGASLATADTRATATAVGVDAGEGSDTVTSESGIRANAVSNVTSDSVSVTAAFSYKGVSAGVALSNTRTDSEADATGISGGGGDDGVINRGSLNAKATATTKTNTITIDIATVGAAIAQASSTASAEAVGLDGGRGVDSLTNEGDVTVIADATADDTSATANFLGYASGDIASNAKAAATGIRSGVSNDAAAPGDTIKNLTEGSIIVESHASLMASNYVVQGGGAAFADAAGSVDARATGFSSTAGADSLVNRGNVDVTARSEADVSSTVMELTGVSAGKAGADLTTRATGVDAGNGVNTITNASKGMINVTSKANATATSLTLNMGVALQRAAITAGTYSTGILSGDDKDDIQNEGDIVVAAATSMGAATGDFSLAGLSIADSVTKASVEGISAGGGADVIVNKGSITAGDIPDGGEPMAFVEVANVSFSFFKVGLGFLGSKASAAGILGGDGDDSIRNKGTIRIGDYDWMSKGKAFGFHGNFLEFFSLTGVGAAGETISTGISGGQGNDDITNDINGVLNIKATAYAISDGAADTTTFGNPKVFANATTKATSTGISGGQGDDVIVNLHKVAASAEARADTSTDAWVGWGNPTADSSSHAAATAWGIDAGEGRNTIRNKNEITTDSIAGVHSVAKADSNVDETLSTATSWSEAFSYGISGGDDGNKVFNKSAGTITATALARTYDPLSGMETKAETDENAIAKTSEPATAYSAGLFLGAGKDTVVNDGSITADSSSDAGAYATSNSYPNNARSEARVSGSASSLGIAAGKGHNSITNNGQILVDAWGNAFPKADSFSRDRTSETIAIADACATATGIETDGEIFNAQAGSIEVQARATSDAHADTEAETTTATATLTATATGIATIANSDVKLRDRIQNDGSITVEAVAGEDETGAVIRSALADTDLLVRSCRAESRVEATVSTAGIHAAGNAAEIINSGDINVQGRANSKVRADAFSRDYNPTANVHAIATGTATGIYTEAGDDFVTNSGTVTVETVTNASPWGSADSWSSRTYTNVYAGSRATGKGVAVGGGDNTVQNEKNGSIFVQSHAAVDSYANSDENAKSYSGTDEDSIVESNAMGIEAGDGKNMIFNQGSVHATAVVDTVSKAEASSTTFTAAAKVWAGGAARAFGITAGDGNNTIVNEGDLVATADNATAEGRPNAVATYPSKHLDWAVSDAGGEETSLTADATGILVGDGRNTIENLGGLTVHSHLYAIASAWANTSSATNHGIAKAGGTATATGILAGDGRNTISNFDNLTVKAEADGYAHGYAEDYATAVAHATAEAKGILTGDGANVIFNSGELTVTAMASAKAVTQEADSRTRSETATARATGIETGNGADWVENEGTIAVRADAEGMTTISESVAIRTGGGNDTIINSGTLIAEFVANSVSGIGTGIDTGAGDDAVHLLDQSVVEGRIEHGDGNDMLLLAGSPIVTAQITGGTGDDLLVFDGKGSVDAPISEFETAAKLGKGTFTVNGLAPVRRIEAIEGTLEIARDHSMTPDGSFAARIDGDGSHGQLKIAGDAQLAGELEVTKGPGVFRNGASYDILRADNVSDNFDSETLPEEMPLLSFQSTTHADRVEVETISKSCTSVAVNPIEMIIARYLDQVMPKATGDFGQYLGEFQSLSRRDFKKAFTSLSPDSYDNSTRASLFASFAFTQALQKRMDMLRSGMTAPTGSPRADSQQEPVLLAYSGANIGDLLGTRNQAEAKRRWALWLDIFGQWGDQDAEVGFTGYDYQAFGGALGFDHMFDERFLAGFGLGYSLTDIDLGQNAGSGDIQSLFGSVYGSYFTDRLYVDATLSYGGQNYENARNVVIGPLQGVAASEHDGNLFSAHLGAGYYFPRNKWRWGPFGLLQYTHLDEDGFQETGAGALNLMVDPRKTDALISRLGLRGGKEFRFDNATFFPELSLAWLHDFDIDDRVVNSSIAGAPGSFFSIPGQTVERNGVTAGAALSLISGSGYRASLKYGGEFRSSYAAHTLYGEIRVEF